MNPLLIGGVGLVKCRFRGGPAIIAVRSKLAPVMQSTNWLEPAPFKTVHLILRYGQAKPGTFFEPILKKHSELPIARELSATQCEAAFRSGALEALFLAETLRALADVAAKFSLPTEWLASFSEDLAQPQLQADAPSARGLS